MSSTERMTAHGAGGRGGRAGLTAALCVAFVAGMIGMAYAAVPLYRLFCQITGFGGTTQVASAAPAAAVDRVVSVRFDANIANDLGWSFLPLTRSVRLKAGEMGEAVFVAENRGSTATTGTAVFNVSPLNAGAYFNKIDCFCFNEQTLQPGERIEMPVTFFVDPAIAANRELDPVHAITLSYTFYPARSAASPADGGSAF